MATNFVTGTTPQLGGGNLFTENSNGEWELAGITGPSIVRQIFTANGTYTPSPGMIVCEVIATGGGGGGGYAYTTTAGDVVGAGGGQAGGTAIKLYTPAEIGATAAVVIGAAGTGGIGSTQTASGDGGTTTFTPTGTGATLSCDGGDLGSNANGAGAGSGNSYTGGSSNGSATGGDINIEGGDGASGIGWDDSTAGKECALGGIGGNSYWGGRGRGANISGTGNHAVSGQPADGYGSGGGGACSRNTDSGDGGAGHEGIVVVTEYIRQNAHWPIATDVNGNEVLDLTGGTASAVNYIDIDNAATGVGPTIAAAGDDAAVPLNLASKGNEEVNLRVNNTGGRAIAFRSDEATGTGTRIRHRWYAKDSAGNDDAMAVTILNCIDNTSASEDAALDFYLLAGGSFPGTADISVRAGGISFDAGTNVMDDYEEGTWTPTYEPASGAFTSVTYDSSRGGIYTKIGNVVHVQGYIRTDAITVGTASGNVFVGGLPFTSRTGGGTLADESAFAISQSSSFGGENPIGLLMDDNATSALPFYKTSVTGSSSPSDVTDLNTGTNDNAISFAGCYTI